MSATRSNLSFESSPVTDRTGSREYRTPLSVSGVFSNRGPVITSRLCTLEASSSVGKKQRTVLLYLSTRDNMFCGLWLVLSISAYTARLIYLSTYLCIIIIIGRHMAGWRHLTYSPHYPRSYVNKTSNQFSSTAWRSQVAGYLTLVMYTTLFLGEEQSKNGLE